MAWYNKGMKKFFTVSGSILVVGLLMVAILFGKSLDKAFSNTYIRDGHCPRNLFKDVEPSWGYCNFTVSETWYVAIFGLVGLIAVTYLILGLSTYKINKANIVSVPMLVFGVLYFYVYFTRDQSFLFWETVFFAGVFILSIFGHVQPGQKRWRS